MSVNMRDLERLASNGQPADRIQVNRSFLAEVHRLLVKGEAAQREANALRARLQIRDNIDALGEKLFGFGRR